MSNIQEEVDCVWNGKFLKDDKHVNDLRAEFLQNLESNINGIESDINSCKDELERIQIIKKLFQWISLPQVYFERFSKSIDSSLRLRERANLAYKNGRYNEALRGYTLAIMFAPMNSEELGLAYGNRSALFVQMKEHHSALQDIKLALACPYPESLKNKLLDRQKKCNDLIIRNDNTRLKSEKNSIGKKYCDENVLRLKTPNPFVTNAEEFVTINYTKERGRRLVVNRNIAAGTVLVFEKPYTYVFANYLTWETTHCHLCSKKILAGVPCNLCTFAIYCNDTCRDGHKNVHYMEHKMIPYLHCHESGLKDLIAIRILIKAGPQLLFSLFQRRRKSWYKDVNENYAAPDAYFNTNKDTVLGFNDEGVYESESYLPVYHLISHTQSTPLKDSVSNGFRAIVLTYLLRDTSTFFDSLKDHYSAECSQEEFEEFVGSLLLRHIENIPCNAVSISELQCERQDLTVKNLKNCKSISYGQGVFCLISLANHSCDPNAVIAKKDEFQHTSLVSVRSLNAGDEIFITYKPQFTSQITKDRRMFLLDRYHFICQCQACTSNWCLESHVTYKLPVIYCIECQKKPCKTCKACEKASMNFAFQLETYQSKLYDADDLLQSGDYIQAIRILKDSLQFFSQHFSSVFSLFQVAQDLYKRALLFMLYSYD
ncbi:SET and MYND domain-containing protein 4-like [Bradysia coprophila]|uniref:SET and MYND domain-containing protein 4-like n=1 Tax=Bradysia coprophila TaxID=38358 RepID=UPI00187DD93A|nr:SET and MYND domain-containing protein 4-like [Bradysia coprophila]